MEWKAWGCKRELSRADDNFMTMDEARGEGWFLLSMSQVFFLTLLVLEC